MNRRINIGKIDIESIYKDANVKCKIENEEYLKNQNYILETVNVSNCIENMLKYKTRKNEKVVFLDVNKVNLDWVDHDNYNLTFNDLKYDTLKSKYLKSREDLLNDRVTSPPHITIIDDNNIMFYNGRNRFANLRDCGALKLPFIIDEHDIDCFANYE